MCGIIFLVKYDDKLDTHVIVHSHDQLIPRGPDKQNSFRIQESNADMFFGFSRLSIMDTSDDGLQPFSDNDGNIVICNGEIYNHKDLAKTFDLKLITKCDCEVILPLFQKNNFQDTINLFDAEFALILFDKKNQAVYAARDRFGVRPLFYGYNSLTKTYGFASEIKAFHNIMEHIEPVEPNKFYQLSLPTISVEIKEYYDYRSIIAYPSINVVEYIQNMIRDIFTEAVAKRLFSDRPIGFLLSGGLDSSLIVAIAARILGPDNIVCFSIGLEDSPDVIASKIVTAHLGIKKHHIIKFDVEEGITAIPDVIRATETYDITTIRASVPQYIMAKYISQKTDIRVVLSGEGSDEIHGSYRYFRDAPNGLEFHRETIRLLKELYMFDNLRTDRTMSGNGLEVRVPFLDFEYVQFIKRIDPNLLMYRTDYMEKKIIRDSFVGYLPTEILYRSKEAFSDAVSSTEINWYKTIQKKAAEIITSGELDNNPFKINKPKTLDALYFRRIFNSIYPERDNVISHYWLPRFQSVEVVDPSATVLKCY
uniref:asparagine synthase (glutamine-hydrolyzing) n=1 Tax=viral metagenome TaxID=1070528 RepID=A0A6C0C8Q2_9ZZZZ